MKAVALLLVALPAVAADYNTCDPFKNCYLHNKRTGREIVLSNSTVTPYRVDIADDFSIRCATMGIGPNMTYTDFFWDNKRTTEWGEPVYMDGDSNAGAYIVPVPYLKTCGMKQVKVQGHVWAEMCYERVFNLEACGVEPTNEPTKAPTKAPTMTPTKSPTKAPTKQPTKNPTKAPTTAPVKQPTSAPVVAASTSSPVASSPSSSTPVSNSSPSSSTPVSSSPQSKSPTTQQPLPMPVPQPVMRPTFAPRAKRTNAPKATPVALPVPAPVPVPVTKVTAAPAQSPVTVATPATKAPQATPASLPVAAPQSRTAPLPVTGIVCASGFKLDQSGYCVRDWCKNNYICPVGSYRRANRNCYSSSDDCTCAQGYVRRLGGRCILKLPCAVGLNWFNQCPANNKLK